MTRPARRSRPRSVGRDTRDETGAVRLVRHADAAAFLAAAEPHLIATEVVNNMIYAIARAAVADPRRWPSPYLATLERAGVGVVGAAVQTPPFVALVTALPPDAVDPLVADLRRARPDLPGVNGPVETARGVAARWAAAQGTAAEPAVALTSYALDRVIPATAPGRLRRCRAEDLELAATWAARFARDVGIEAVDGMVAHMRSAYDAGLLDLWEDGRPVSMVACVGQTPHVARIGLVYTPPELRRSGYATACVAAFCERLLARPGTRTCCLNADRANPTSNGVYRAVGFRPVEETLEFRF